MALSKVDYNSLNVTAAASKALKWNSGADGFETGDVAGSLVLLETQTASSSATISFTSNIDSTYKEYIFTFINMHPSANADLTFQGSIDSGSNYNVAKTSTSILYYHFESGSASGLQYDTNRDLAQATGVQPLVFSVGNGNDESASGELWLFNPSSTTFVKNWMSRSSQARHSDAAQDFFTAGYCNTTTAIDGVQFTMSAGTIDSGDICLYGLTT